MKLCLSIIEDEIGFPVIYSNRTGNCLDLHIEKFVYYQGESLLSSGILYVAKGEELGKEVGFTDGAALLCLGMPPETLVCTNLPLLVYAADINETALINGLLAAFEHYQELEKALDEGVYNDYGYQYMVEMFTPFIKNEIAIVDANYQILALSYSEYLLLSVSGLPQPGSDNVLPLEVINYFKGNHTFFKVKAMKEPFFYQEKIFNCRCLCMNIVFEQDFALRVVSSEATYPFRDYDPLLLKYFTGFVDRIYKNALIGKKGFVNGSLTDVLHEMLSGKHVELWQIYRGLQGQKWAKADQFIVMCIKPTSGDYLNHTVYYHCGVINTHFPGIIAFEFEGDIIGLVNIKYFNGSVSNLNIKLMPMLRDNNFRAGFSDVFENLESFVYRYKQAAIALSVGIPTFPSEWFYHFSEQAVGYMIEPFADMEHIMILGAKEILVLRNYDEQNGTAFLATVKAYFDQRLNKAKTAQVLYIHRATLIHRLERIKEISGLDFQNTSKNLYCQLTLALLEKHERCVKAEAIKTEGLEESEKDMDLT